MSETSQGNVQRVDPVMEPQDGAEEIGKEKIFSKPFLMTMGALLIFGAVAGGLFVWSKSQPPKYVVVDLVQITETMKDAARKKALAAKVTDEQRGLILEQYKRQMSAMQDVLDKEADRCRCSVFVKSAIVSDSSGAEDITARVERQLQAVK